MLLEAASRENAQLVRLALTHILRPGEWQLMQARWEDKTAILFASSVCSRQLAALTRMCYSLQSRACVLVTV